MSVNKWIGIGNATRDAELKFTPQGKAVASVSIACNEKFKGRDGQMQEKTEFVNLVAWEGLAEIFGRFVTKGKQIYVEGKLQTRSYDDRDGNKKYIAEIRVTEMRLLGGGGSSPSERADRGSQVNSRSESTGGGGCVEPPFHDDSEIPF